MSQSGSCPVCRVDSPCSRGMSVEAAAVSTRNRSKLPDSLCIQRSDQSCSWSHWRRNTVTCSIHSTWLQVQPPSRPAPPLAGPVIIPSCHLLGFGSNVARMTDPTTYLLFTHSSIPVVVISMRLQLFSSQPSTQQQHFRSQLTLICRRGVMSRSSSGVSAPAAAPPTTLHHI